MGLVPGKSTVQPSGEAVDEGVEGVNGRGRDVTESARVDRGLRGPVRSQKDSRPGKFPTGASRILAKKSPTGRARPGTRIDTLLPRDY